MKVALSKFNVCILQFCRDHSMISSPKTWWGGECGYVCMWIDRCCIKIWFPTFLVCGSLSTFFFRNPHLAFSGWARWRVGLYTVGTGPIYIPAITPSSVEFPAKKGLLYGELSDSSILHPTPLHCVLEMQKERGL